MFSKSLVSVIMIFLNAEKFIQEAIESVFTQTYDNWELLLVDDGSTDWSTKVALQYAEQYPGKVRYLEHEGRQNRGMSASRNLGISNAAGEYIAFLDADDVWLPHKLEQQVAILQSQPEAAMVYGPTQAWYSWTGNAEDTQRDFLTELDVQLNTLAKPPTLLIPFLLHEVPAATVGLIRHEVARSTGGYEEMFGGMYEDQAFYAKLCVRAPIYVASECWYKWRKHPNSCCAIAVNEEHYHAARVKFLNWLEQYLLQQGVQDAGTWQALREQLWPYRHPLLDRLSKNLQSFGKQMQKPIKGLAKRIIQQTLPVHTRDWLKAKWRGEEYCPPMGKVRFGDLRRLTPCSRQFGFDRGLPIDRYYIEQFLSNSASDIQGRVLEIGDDTYTRKFGGDRVTQSDVLHVVEGNPKATFVGDLTCADHIPSDTFDCVILTQTLQLIYDVRAAVKTLYRILKPNGVALVTVPGISQIDRYYDSDGDHWGDYWYWSFTTLSARRLLEEAFATADLQVEAHGNVLSAIAFLHGLATEELRQEELDYCDRDYEALITIRAVKPEVAM